MTGKNNATIDAESGVATLINVFEVEPAKQAELAQFLSEATDEVFRHQPGFVSVSIHSSLDGTRVVNYAQWKSKEDIDRVLKDPEAQAQARQAAAIAKGVSPAVYKIDSVHVG
jgi:quinol monooxygenase YgiN